MSSVDTAAVINWVISGFIGLVFGIISAWATHRYQKERDSIAWEREKEKLRQQFEHEKKLLEIQFQQRLVESELKLAEQKSNNIRAELTRGIDNSEKTLKELILAKQRMLAEMSEKELKMRMEKSMYSREVSEALRETRYYYLTGRLKTYLIAGLIGLAIVIGTIVVIYFATR